MDRKKLDEQIKQYQEFNKIYKDLVEKLLKLDIKDSDIYRIKARIKLVIGISEDELTKRVGKRLFEYYDQIKAGDTEFFLNNDLSEVKDATDDAKRILNKLKDKWRLFNKNEQQIIFNDIKRSLQIYINVCLVQN